MKRIIILLVGIALSCGLFAQHFDPQNKQEVRFSIGGIVIDTQLGVDVNSAFTPYRAYNSSYYHRDQKKTAGALNLAYYYHFDKYFALGLNVSWQDFNQNYYSNTTLLKIGSLHEYLLGVTPDARFTWFRVKCVQFYTTVGMSVYVDQLHQNLEAIDGTPNPYSERRTKVELSVTPIGMTVGGKKVFGFTEIRIGGSMGLFIAGLGYRF